MNNSWGRKVELSVSEKINKNPKILSLPPSLGNRKKVL